MKELKHDLLTSKYTEVFHEEGFKHNAPHYFEVMPVISVTDKNGGDGTLAKIHFQEGPIKECGVNGVCNEDLIAMVICRLEHFQKSEWSCRENAIAISKLEEALLWLRKRTMGREQRGVEGTSEK
ncbi:MAG: ABC transporter ATPase [Eubacteriales bacterium]|nr:ABC transporter ATPase [Eubacteriales bacterium]